MFVDELSFDVEEPSFDAADEPSFDDEPDDAAAEADLRLSVR